MSEHVTPDPDDRQACKVAPEPFNEEVAKGAAFEHLDGEELVLKCLGLATAMLRLCDAELDAQFYERKLRDKKLVVDYGVRGRAELASMVYDLLKELRRRYYATDGRLK